MKKILVPTDFSDYALRAATYAAEMATKSGATLYVVHVLARAQAVLFQPGEVQEMISNVVHNNRQKELLAFRNNLTGIYPGVPIETELIEGDIEEAIPQYCRTQNIDLVIMGTRGASGAREIFLGSTTSGIIARSMIPVLAIPDEYALEEPDAILFATNHFEKKPGLLTSVVDLAKLFSAPVHVIVYVEKEDDAPDFVTTTRQMNEYVKYLQSQFPDVAFKGEVIEGTDFEGALQLYAVRHEIDVIGMITYPKRFFDKIFHRSATQKMTFHSHIPVLAIPAGE